MAKTRIIKTPLMCHLLSYTPFSTLLYNPRKSNKSHKFLHPSSSLVLLCFSLRTFFVVSILLILGNIDVSHKPNCLLHFPIQLASFSAIFPDYGEELILSKSEMVLFLAFTRISAMNLSKEEVEFWKKPDNQGYVPCLDFGLGYRRESYGDLFGETSVLGGGCLRWVESAQELGMAFGRKAFWYCGMFGRIANDFANRGKGIMGILRKMLRNESGNKKNKCRGKYTVVIGEFR